MGGGFGDCTLTLLNNKAMEQATASCSEVFEEKFGYRPQFYRVSLVQAAGESVK